VPHALTAQRPATHAAPVAWGSMHALPHAPQLFGSVDVLTQSPAQFVVPVPHVVAHAPAEHT
jgi:hypothetical protein